MPAAEVLASNHELWHVEASFRMSKTDLRARPMFHHTRDAIEAHLTIVVAALAVARYLQGATGLSIRRSCGPSARYRRSPSASPATTTSPKTPSATPPKSSFQETAAVCKSTGRLACEVCGRDSAQVYGVEGVVERPEESAPDQHVA